MRNQLRKSVGLLLLFSVLLLSLPLVSKARGRLGEAGKHRAAIEAVAEYMTGQTDVAGKMLEKLCFDPSASTSNWRHFPAVRKIALAYEAAEAANPGVGGDVLLARLSQALARQYEAVRVERSLAPYMSMRVNARPCIDFQNIKKRVYFSELPKKVTEAIRTIAQYTTNGPLGSPEAVIRFLLEGNPNYSEEDAAGFLCQSETTEDALLRAFSFVPEREREAKLRPLLAKLYAHNDASRLEPTLNAILAEPQSNVSLVTSIPQRRVGPQAELKSAYIGSSELRLEEPVLQQSFSGVESLCSSCQFVPVLGRTMANTAGPDVGLVPASRFHRTFRATERGSTPTSGSAHVLGTPQREPGPRALGLSTQQRTEIVLVPAPPPPRLAAGPGSASHTDANLLTPVLPIDLTFRAAGGSGTPDPTFTDVLRLPQRDVRPEGLGLFLRRSDEIILLRAPTPPRLASSPGWPRRGSMIKRPLPPCP